MPLPPDLRIRLASLPDAVPLSVLMARTFTDAFGHENRPSNLELHLSRNYSPELQRRELLDPQVRTLVAETSEGFAGYAQLRRDRIPECVTGTSPIELRRFYVDRPWQGRGLAQALMAAARSEASTMGGFTLWLGVWEHNPRAIAFYRREGFADVGSLEFVLGLDHQTDRVMVCSLGRAPRLVGEHLATS
jgi:GNAT superfamily N-acetyltransferase